METSAGDFQRIHTGPVYLRVAQDQLLAPAEFASEILNLVPTDEGSLRSVWGPVEYHPTKYTDDGGQESIPDTTYDGLAIHGLHHCKLMGGTRDVLLRAQGGNIFVHEGWKPDWSSLAGTNISALYSNSEMDDLTQHDPHRFLTQFIDTPDGVVIVPQGHRPLFYDGETILPLGYAQAPGAPTGVGPRRGIEDDGTATGVLLETGNASGYSHRGRTMNRVMGFARIGTVDNSAIDISTSGTKTNTLGGVLLEGEWACVAQYINYRGDLSPVSPPSNPVQVAREENLTKSKRNDEDESSNQLRIQAAWEGIEAGPDGTVGRLLGRTKDRRNSGDLRYYLLPQNTGGEEPDSSTIFFATVPDNTSRTVPDNIPDAWLRLPLLDVAPMPTFRMGALAFGRLWVANFLGSPGEVMASYPGKWGTMDPRTRQYPDAGAAEVTGIFSCAYGLLIFTETSTYLVTPSDDGQRFVYRTLSSRLGCVSPDTIEVLPSGAVVWLGPNGFNAYAGDQVVPISDNHEPVQRITHAARRRACAVYDERRKEYRCAAPLDGAVENNHVFVFADGGGWRSYDYIRAGAMCATADHRRAVLALGDVYATDSDAATTGWKRSVWVMDHAGLGVITPEARTARVRTGWLKMHRSHRRSSGYRVELLLRETSRSNLTVNIYRDWRRTPAVDTKTDVARYPDYDAQEVWGSTELGATRTDPLFRDAKGRDESRPNAMRERRPYWVKMDVHVPDCEVFAIEVEGTGDWDFMGIVFAENGGHKGGASKPGRG